MKRKRNDGGFAVFESLLTGAVTIIVFSAAYVAVIQSVNSIATSKYREAAIAAAKQEIEVLRSTPYANVGISAANGDLIYISPEPTTNYNPSSDTLRQRTVVLSDNGTADTSDDVLGTLTVTGANIDDPGDGLGVNDTKETSNDYKSARIVVTWPFRSKTNSYDTGDTFLYGLPGINTYAGGPERPTGFPDARPAKHMYMPFQKTIEDAIEDDIPPYDDWDENMGYESNRVIQLDDEDVRDELWAQQMRDEAEREKQQKVVDAIEAELTDYGLYPDPSAVRSNKLAELAVEQTELLDKWLDYIESLDEELDLVMHDLDIAGTNGYSPVSNAYLVHQYYYYNDVGIPQLEHMLQHATDPDMIAQLETKLAEMKWGGHRNERDAWEMRQRQAEGVADFLDAEAEILALAAELGLPDPDIPELKVPPGYTSGGSTTGGSTGGDTSGGSTTGGSTTGGSTTGGSTTGGSTTGGSTTGGSSFGGSSFGGSSFGGSSFGI